MFQLYAAVSLVALAGLLASEALRFEAGRWVFKVVASAGFVAAAATAGGALSTSYGRLILAALVLSLVGDVLLVPSSKRTFVVGLASFLLAHVAYALAFVAHGVSLVPFSVAIAPVCAFGFAVAAWLLPHVERPMRAPVIAYLVVILAMVALAIGALGERSGAVRLGAALAFLVSDVFVARDRFVAPGFINRGAGLPLYYGAQLAFAATV